MSELLCNGTPVVAAKITRPRLGSWVAELVVDTDEALDVGTRAELTDGDGASLFAGTVQRGAVTEGRLALRVISGAGGLGKTLDARGYHQAPPRVILTDLARETGETLAPLTEAVLDAPLRAWARPRVDGAAQLRQLSEAVGLVWRCQADGRQWLGRETWPDAGLVEGRDYELLHDEPARHRWTVSTVTLADAVRIAPGTVLEGRRVSLVEHVLERDSTRTTVTFEAVDATVDAVRDALERTIRRATSRLPYSAGSLYRVVAQRGDGQLEVVPVDAARGLPALVVPLLLSIPGSVRVPQGARVLVEYADGDPSQPYASLFETVGVDEVKIGGGAKRIARAGDRVSLQMRAIKVAEKIEDLFVRASSADEWQQITWATDDATEVTAVIVEGESKTRSD